MKVRRRDRGKAQIIGAVLDNNDLLYQILILLPAKSLIRFKSLSKAWSSLISDPQFSIDHTKRNFGENHYLVSEFFLQAELPRNLSKLEPILYFPLRSHRNCITPASIKYFKSLYVIHSCNGLFLCRNIEKKRYMVYNFTTWNHRVLPESRNRQYNSSGRKHIVLAFDPSKSRHYKVVWHSPCRRQPKFDIFSSEDGSWKELSIEGLVHNFPDVSRLVFWNGAFHWIEYTDEHRQLQLDNGKFTSNTIMSGNFSENGMSTTKYFGAVGDSLLLLSKSWLGNSQICSVLEMNKNSNCWALKYRVDFGHKNFSVLYIKSEASDKHPTVVLAVATKIFSYYLPIQKDGGGNSLSIARGEVREYKSNYNLESASRSFHPIIRCLAPV